ncbi:dTDP-4-dehydrorhamnose reductase [Kaarinaea lacus]
MKILITGADGQVGREFPDCAKAIGDSVEILNLGRQQLDITQKGNVEQAIESIMPTVVVNAAAYTAVDKAEEQVEIAYAVNRDGPGNLAEVCATKNIPLIQISTDYVFDGGKSGPYLETDLVNPMSVYGKSKLEGEQRVQRALDKHIILRTSWVFGAHGKNFVYTIVRLAKEKQELRVVNDQLGCPTSAASIAAAIISICKSISSNREIDWGVYHYCGLPETNWFEFCKAIIENTKQSQSYAVKNIQPVATSEYPTAAVRPQNSVLCCDKIYQQFGIKQQRWIDGLQDMIKHPRFSQLTN